MIWYSPHDMLPPRLVPVRVQWEARVFPAVRTIHAKKKIPCWASLKDGDMAYLPPKDKERYWGEHPTAWQPLDPETWEYTLPDPLLSPVGSLSSPTPSYEGQVEERPGALWWRHPEAVKRSLGEIISIREAEGRVMRAICVDWSLRVDGPNAKTNAATLARLGPKRLSRLELAKITDSWADIEEVTDPKSDWRPRFIPTGTDLDDYPVAFGWFNALNPPELWHKSREVGQENRAQKVLRMRANDPPYSWSLIADRWSLTPKRAQEVYEETVTLVHRAANGRKVYKHLDTQDPMLVVRERNRAALL